MRVVGIGVWQIVVTCIKLSKLRVATASTT